MWWIILIIVILIIFLIIVVVVVATNSNNSCNNPCSTTPETSLTSPCKDDDTILLSCGDEVQPTTCENHGRIGNYQYYRVHKGVKTYIPFRPTRIQGEYKTCIITYGNDEIDYAIIHKKEEGQLKPLPLTYRKVYVIIT